MQPPAKRSRTRAIGTPLPLPSYDRRRDLPRIIPLLACELETSTPEQHLRLIGLIRRALRAERCRGQTGDWSYDLARHAALLAAYRCEYTAWRVRQPEADGGTAAHVCG